MTACDPGTPGRAVRVEGVGVAYHPFLHDALLAQAEAFDFVELPLDLYIDPARSALMDPGDAKLKEIIATKPCTWRGTVLSIGSVEPSFPKHLVARIRRRLEQACAASYTETIGFRSLAGSDLGLSQAMPCTEAAANWIAIRHGIASDALGLPILLQLPRSPVTAPATGLDRNGFLARIAAKSGAGFVLDTSDLGQMAADCTPVEAVRRLPPGSIVQASLSAAAEAEWTVLAALAEHAAIQAIVLRRDRDLFPLHTIAADARRAAALIGPVDTAPARLPSSPSTGSDPLDAEGLETLRSYQVGFLELFSTPQPPFPPQQLRHIAPAASQELAKAVQSWRNWRMQVDDTHKTQQIAEFLSRGAERRASWSV